MEPVSDAEVMVASLADPEAFGAIFDRHAETLLRYLVRRVELDTAEGLLAELFRVAFERRARFDPARTNARPWLYGIAANLLLKHRRSEARRLRATARLLAAQPSSARDCGSALDVRVLWPRLVEALEALVDAERDALLLFAWEGLSYEDVAVALDVPVGTVRSRIHRARRRLRELIDGSGKGEGGSDEPNPARARR